MKLNRNYCLIAFLFIVILFCSLGNNILEGFNTALEVQRAGATSASNEESQYQKMMQGEGLDQSNYNTNFNSNSDFNMASNSGSNSVPPPNVTKANCSKYPNYSWNYNHQSDKIGCHLLDINACANNTVWSDTEKQCVTQGVLTQSLKNSSNKSKPKTVGGDTDYYGCKPSAGEKWCDSLQTCIQPWETTCPPNKPQPTPKPGNDYCGNGTIWDKIKKMCITDPNTPSNNSNNSNNYPTDDNFNYHDNYNQTTKIKNKQSNIFGLDSLDSKSNIPSDQQDQYMLKSQMVPPVCPACPPVTTCSGNKKVQPCPPCARCPEPAFDCKKVPNYNSTNTDYLPRPMLNSFSQF